MAYGENWLAMQRQMSDNRKPRLKVDKKTEQKIQSEIRQLEKESSALYENNNITDEELKELAKPIHEKINQLIDSMYETKEEVKKRLQN